MIFCPSSTESQTHKRVIAAVADRAVRTQKVKLLNTICEDDEKARIERIKVFKFLYLQTLFRLKKRS